MSTELEQDPGALVHDVADGESDGVGEDIHRIEASGEEAARPVELTDFEDGPYKRGCDLIRLKRIVTPSVTVNRSAGD